MIICWERAVCATLSYGAWGRMWNLVVLVHDHCLFIYLSQITRTIVQKKINKCPLVKDVSHNRAGKSPFNMF